MSELGPQWWLDKYGVKERNAEEQMLVEKDGNGCGEMKVHTGEVHLVQKVQSEGDRRLQGGVRGKCIQ